MKTLGLIGGTSWLSTIDYYRIINQSVNERLGALHSAQIFMYSLNLEEFKNYGFAGDWIGAGTFLSGIAQRLEKAGADCIVLCANTPHMVADTVQANIRVPLIHIAEATAKEIKQQQIHRVGMLGTKFTMEKAFFRDRLSNHGIEMVIPGEEDRDFIHASIFDELGKGIFTTETKKRYLDIIAKLGKGGAEGVIFGCTEIPMLIKPSECSDTSVFDTTLIHAKAAVDFALT